MQQTTIDVPAVVIDAAESEKLAILDFRDAENARPCPGCLLPVVAGEAYITCASDLTIDGRKFNGYAVRICPACVGTIDGDSNSQVRAHSNVVYFIREFDFSLQN
jgi:hypothetical protein